MKKFDLLMCFRGYRKLKKEYDKLDQRFTSVSGSVSREYKLRLKATEIKSLIEHFNDKIYIKEKNRKYRETNILERIYEIIER